MRYWWPMPAEATADAVAKPLRAGLANGPIFAILMWLICSRETTSPVGVTMPLLRFIAVALFTAGPAVALGFSAVAEPLDKESCASLQIQRNKLLTRDMQAALDRGPDWVKDHLNDQELEQVRQFLGVEEKIQFRCRGGGVAKPALQAAGTPAQTPGGAEVVPLPDRKPAPPTETASDTKPSQTLADSAKTPPSKAKATR
jgi:hypothetical protein